MDDRPTVIHEACPTCGAYGSYRDDTEPCAACGNPYDADWSDPTGDDGAVIAFAIAKRIATALEAIHAEMVAARERREFGW